MRCVCRHWEDGHGVRTRMVACLSVLSCSHAWHKPSMATGAVLTFLFSFKALHPLLRCRSIPRVMSCEVTVVEFVFRRADSRFKAMICSSKQCLPNFSSRALPVIVCVSFASKRSVGVEAPSATRGLAITCTRFSRLYTIRLDETRAEIHFRSSEICLLFSLITNISESSILSSCRTHILNLWWHLRGIDDSCVVLVDQRLFVLRGQFDCGAASLLYIYVSDFYGSCCVLGLRFLCEIYVCVLGLCVM